MKHLVLFYVLYSVCWPPVAPQDIECKKQNKKNSTRTHGTRTGAWHTDHPDNSQASTQRSCQRWSKQPIWLDEILAICCIPVLGRDLHTYSLGSEGSLGAPELLFEWASRTG